MSCSLIHEVNILVNSCVYQALLDIGAGGAVVVVLFDEGVAGTGLGAAAATCDEGCNLVR